MIKLSKIDTVVFNFRDNRALDKGRETQNVTKPGHFFFPSMKKCSSQALPISVRGNKRILESITFSTKQYFHQNNLN